MRNVNCVQLANVSHTLREGASREAGVRCSCTWSHAWFAVMCEALRPCVLPRTCEAVSLCGRCVVCHAWQAACSLLSAWQAISGLLGSWQTAVGLFGASHQTVVGFSLSWVNGWQPAAASRTLRDRLAPDRLLRFVTARFLSPHPAAINYAVTARERYPTPPSHTI
eukprot:356034-Chlamydomonas_euryale.AAC.11